MKYYRKFRDFNWVVQVVIIGLLIPLLYFVVKTVVESEIQVWWQSTVKPFISTSVILSYSIPRWKLLGTILGLVLILIGVARVSFLLGYRKCETLKEKLTGEGVPQIFLERRQITNTDVMSAITAYRLKKIGLIDLATTVIYAVNSNVITLQAGRDALNNTPIGLKKVNGKIIYVLSEVVRRR